MDVGGGEVAEGVGMTYLAIYADVVAFLDNGGASFELMEVAEVWALRIERDCWCLTCGRHSFG